VGADDGIRALKIDLQPKDKANFMRMEAERDKQEMEADVQDPNVAILAQYF